MNLSQLEMFRAVAQTGSISAAAQLVHRVPSNLTTRIKQLEAELGVALFIRENQRLRLSPAGRNFLTYNNRILDLVDEARISVAGTEPQGIFALGALESMPGSTTVSIWPLADNYRFLTTWLIWRRGVLTRNLTEFAALASQLTV